MMTGLTRLMAFFQLIRYPNLLFIALTQAIFYFRIIRKASDGQPLLSSTDFLLLMIASVVIAAAGYIINDYFDMDIDYVNKPDKMVIGRVIGRRWAMLLHMMFSLTGLFLTAIVSMHLGSLWLLFFNFLSVFLLLLYSTSFKKQLIIGNVIISLLTAWVIISLFVAELKWDDMLYMKSRQSQLSVLYKYTLIYAAFAFIVSLIREVVKDAEDQVGDKLHGCRTMPVLWGERSTKIFLFVWLLVLIGLLLSLATYVLVTAFSWQGLFFAAAILVQLTLITQKLSRAHTIKDYGKLSSILKWLMLTGILSMLSF